MKKIAVFGKPGSGKSTLSKRLAVTTKIKLHALDNILFSKKGDMLDRKSYDAVHDTILDSESWIIDGFGPQESFYRRLEAADTLVYIDLPYLVCYWLVTKRFFKGLFVSPEGWPDGSSVLKGTLASYKVLKRCPEFWNDDFMRHIEQISSNKSLHVIRSVSALDHFISEHFH